ncbi:MAG: hypothetical protein GXO39_00060 [Thermotogae bacterium]|nr:hypothetical protein [Thermotogota bacterium]
MAEDKLREEILGIVSGFCSTSVGEKVVLSLRPDYEAAKREFGDIAVALSEYENGMSLSFPRIPDLEEVFSYLDKFGSLDGTKLWTVADFVEGVLNLRSKVHSNRLARYLHVPSHLVRLSRQIRENLSPEGRIRTDKHSTLARLISRRNEVREKLLSTFSDIIRTHREKLREGKPVIKGGRLSLAVISNYRLDGIVHGFSATTETIFVEPYEVVPLQNTLIQLEDQIREYEERILRSLSTRVIRSANVLRRIYSNLGKLDSIFARAKFSIEYDARIPRFGDSLKLIKVREPILYRTKGKDTVPLDLDLKNKALLITGPNAGGKTVSLRTVASAILMASMGIPVLAEESEIPYGARVFMLGFEDETDLRRGLSSFTSELAHLREIVAEAEEGDVVLFDEVFASTDPDEASALAYSTAEYLSKRGTYVLMSTHFSTLKVLAKNSALFEVATVEEYRLVMGSVGESGGIRTARAFLPAEIVNRADEILRRVPSYILELRREYEEQVEKLRRERKEVRESLRRIRAAIGRGDVGQVYAEVESSVGRPPIEEGKEYLIKKLGVRGKVLRIKDEDAVVQVRNFQLVVKLEDLI